VLVTGGNGSSAVEGLAGSLMRFLTMNPEVQSDKPVAKS
jgi:hypothetical protein